jgi:hypothetical protein
MRVSFCSVFDISQDGFIIPKEDVRIDAPQAEVRFQRGTRIAPDFRIGGLNLALYIEGEIEIQDREDCVYISRFIEPH